MITCFPRSGAGVRQFPPKRPDGASTPQHEQPPTGGHVLGLYPEVLLLFLCRRLRARLVEHMAHWQRIAAQQLNQLALHHLRRRQVGPSVGDQILARGQR